jgi:hypothetical protein
VLIIPDDVFDVAVALHQRLEPRRSPR